ncbi:cuticle protein CP14.6-like [Toxorhynchites rutilus septentrionalis]|uniref:cuticle protein CP14.6-like n=1 Tax=Toxorhynchites rutilus septentrionalis TaxID=329112 RepID=UPI00247A0D4D|nr:cuticle protein CP14.6-like [Toxorhynchites rutilus septentrionalis]
MYRTGINMMKFVLVCVISVGAILAAPPLKNLNDDPNGIALVRYNSDNNNEAGYKFTYEQSNKQIFSELGAPRDVSGGAKILAVEGAYTFVAPDGQTYWVNYRADENGFLPKSGTGTTGGIQAGQDAPVKN